MPRWAKIGGLVLLVLVGGAVVVIAVAWTRLPEIVADRASKAIGRPVKIGSLRLSPGRWVGVTLQDASLGNLPGGTRPVMASVGSVAAEVALWPLLHGKVVARGLKIEHADILLEKVDGQPNWRNGPKQPDAPGGGRAGFPTLLSADLQGVLTFRTTAGHDLVSKLDGVTLTVASESGSESAPVRLAGPGSYQGVPITMDLGLGSYDQLHDATVPFPTDIRMVSGETTLHFVGTMTDPLNVDGADGTISLVAPTPGVLEKVAGVDPAPAPSLRLGGALQREHDSWLLQQAKGALGEAQLESGTLHYVEGNSDAKTPDKVETTLKFGEVDADRLMAAFRRSGDSGGGGFVPEAAPNPTVSATVSAASVSYDKLSFAAPTLSVVIAPDLMSVREASAGMLGGKVHAEGQVRGEGGKTGTLSATLDGTGLEVSRLRQALGAGKLPLAGRMDVHAVVEGRGATATAALEAGRGSMVATMAGGSVSQQMVELASTDVAGLLRSSTTMIPLECVLAVAELRGGVATVGPVRVRSSQGTIMARGQVDVLRNTLDVVVASEARTTAALALDIPVRVSGRFDDPSIVPAGSGADRSTLSSAIPRSIAAPLRTEAERSACAR